MPITYVPKLLLRVDLMIDAAVLQAILDKLSVRIAVIERVIEIAIHKDPDFPVSFDEFLKIKQDFESQMIKERAG